jgi:hypothetical protein
MSGIERVKLRQLQELDQLLEDLDRTIGPDSVSDLG